MSLSLPRKSMPPVMPGRRIEGAFTHARTSRCFRRLLLGGALATGAAVTGVGAAYAAPAAGAAGAEAPLPVHTPRDGAVSAR